MNKIKKLLVANRGEIAIRCLRAASELEIKTVAIYTYEDRYSLHRYKADEAYQIGHDNDPLKPYLDIEEIIRIAKKYEVDAIHPGYGFLSENVNFNKRCREAGIVFIGPSPEAMNMLGDKVAAKKIAQACSVPMIEDSKISLTDSSVALSEAQRIGLPVILKAAAGGGGRGMRVIRNEEDLEKSFTEAKREAANAFGDDTIFIEKFVDNPKHIEVQILGDEYGNLVHLFERDCSLQRRFQKVIEIAPAPSLKQKTKDALYDYALRIAKHVNYSCAGTVEFLVDEKENIFFIEVNPRIQVEHTVTEEVTGIDIVRAQILIADGVALSAPAIDIQNQNEISCNGFAIQCRITTEDPQNDFKPDYGTIIAYRNAGGYGIRLDEGSSYQGVKVSPFFDSMLVKVTSSGRTLQGASARMLRALGEFRIRGVKTNIRFLENVIRHSVFKEGRITVPFIQKHPELFKFKTTQDSGTKVLRYLADVMVNGNPDLNSLKNTKTFSSPRIPQYDFAKPFADGTKQKLTALGPEKFAQWLKNEKVIHYTDCTFRDAHQSLLATRVRTIDMMNVARAFAQNHPQLFSMEVWGGATFDVSLRFLHEDPWRRLQLFREAIPNILLQMLIRGSNAIGYAAYPDNLVEKFIEKSWENGIDVFRIFDSLNWTKSMRVSINAVRNLTGGLAEACICYTGDILNPERKKYSLQYYVDLAKELEDSGAHILAIKDMAGLLKPYAAEKLITELKKNISIPIHLHTHDTSAVQCATYIKAIEAGVNVVDVALGSLSGLTSQPNFNSLVEVMRGTPCENKFDIDSLNEFSNYWEVVREWYYPFESGLQAGTAEVYKHEIPGGQYSNLKPQAVSLGLGNKMEEIKKAYEDVNNLFGDIVKVTPSSKVVGDMALYMVTNNLSNEEVFTKGQTLSFPDSVKSMFRGDLGQPPGGFPKDLQKIILKDEKPYTDLPNAHIKPIDFDTEFEAFKNKFDDRLTFLDFLSYKFYPKVFEDYYKNRQQYGDLMSLPTIPFFYGMKNNEEIIVDIGKGKTILIRLLYVGDADENGMRTVYFRLNGQTRTVDVLDKSQKSKKQSHIKASAENHIGAPLQGMLSKIFVKEGDTVKRNTPLFVIEAMKMETTITAPKDMTVKKIYLTEKTLVESDDLVVEV
ncbi:MAG TPA: pyruvate carboxylase [Bacteroidia bacterium]|nr:pyruvate carboxylase [Bacteroidia bacterium]HNU33658.1 pyruvate carboxylase [Bacteroidia bacterium]